MNRKFASAVMLFAFAAGGQLAWLGASARPKSGLQTQSPAKSPVIFTTAPKVVAAQLKLADGSLLAVRGRATLTVTRANEDDSLTATLVYSLPDEARRKIAQSSRKALNAVPAGISLKELTANFVRGTACPVIRLSVTAPEADVAGARLRFERVVLDVYETPDQMNQLFCSWARQINVKRQRRGIIAAINRLIVGEEDEVENKPANP